MNALAFSVLFAATIGALAVWFVFSINRAAPASKLAPSPYPGGDRESVTKSRIRRLWRSRTTNTPPSRK